MAEYFIMELFPVDDFWHNRQLESYSDSQAYTVNFANRQYNKNQNIKNN